MFEKVALILCNCCKSKIAHLKQVYTPHIMCKLESMTITIDYNWTIGYVLLKSGTNRVHTNTDDKCNNTHYSADQNLWWLGLSIRNERALIENYCSK